MSTDKVRFWRNSENGKKYFIVDGTYGFRSVQEMEEFFFKDRWKEQYYASYRIYNEHDKSITTMDRFMYNLPFLQQQNLQIAAMCIPGKRVDSNRIDPKMTFLCWEECCKIDEEGQLQKLVGAMVFDQKNEDHVAIVHQKQMDAMKEKSEQGGESREGIQYIGSYKAEKEGVRHFFLLPLTIDQKVDETKWLTITHRCGRSNFTYLPVYTSSGSHTGELCGPSGLACLIPFFGTAAVKHKVQPRPRTFGAPKVVSSSGDVTLASAILKMDYLQAFRSSVKSTHQQQLMNTYFKPGGITSKQMQAFGFSSENMDSTTAKNFKVKMGNKLFMDIIIRYQDVVASMVQTLQTTKGTIKELPDLAAINSHIACNNVLGMDLSQFSTVEENIQNLGAAFHAGQEDLAKIHVNMKKLKRDEPFKYRGLLRLPVFNFIIAAAGK